MGGAGQTADGERGSGPGQLSHRVRGHVFGFLAEQDPRRTWIEIDPSHISATNLLGGDEVREAIQKRPLKHALRSVSPGTLRAAQVSVPGAAQKRVHAVRRRPPPMLVPADVGVLRVEEPQEDVHEQVLRPVAPGIRDVHGFNAERIAWPC